MTIRFGSCFGLIYIRSGPLFFRLKWSPSGASVLPKSLFLSRECFQNWNVDLGGQNDRLVELVPNIGSTVHCDTPNVTCARSKTQIDSHPQTTASRTASRNFQIFVIPDQWFLFFQVVGYHYVSHVALVHDIIKIASISKTLCSRTYISSEKQV